MQSLITKNTQKTQKTQRGMVFIVSLLVLVVVALAAAAMMRGLEGNVFATGNMAFRQAAEAAIGIGVQNAEVFLAAGGGAPGGDASASGYYATLQAGADVDGIPAALQGSGSSPSGGYTGPVLNDTAGNQIRYVVERLCQQPGAATIANCEIDNPPVSIEVGGTANEPSVPTWEGAMTASVRVTVRVDGPAGTRVFGQTILK